MKIISTEETSNGVIFNAKGDLLGPDITITGGTGTTGRCFIFGGNATAEGYPTFDGNIRTIIGSGPISLWRDKGAVIGDEVSADAGFYSNCWIFCRPFVINENGAIVHPLNFGYPTPNLNNTWLNLGSSSYQFDADVGGTLEQWCRSHMFFAVKTTAGAPTGVPYTGTQTTSSTITAVTPASIGCTQLTQSTMSMFDQF